MKKETLTQHKINQAWKRTVVFMKLLRHKKANWNLKWNYDDYIYAVTAHFRETENMLIKESYKDDRWGDRKSQEFKQKRLLEWKRVVFDRFQYDDQIRAIIKKIESNYNVQK